MELNARQRFELSKQKAKDAELELKQKKKILFRPSTKTETDEAKFYNFLFDEFLYKTKIGDIPTNLKRDDVHFDYCRFVGRCKDFDKTKLGTELYFINKLVENLTDEQWELFIKSTYKPTIVNKGVIPMYMKSTNYTDIVSDKTKHSYSLLSNKYDATKVYNSFFKGEIGLCTNDCFNDWFVNGYKSDKIKPTLQGRQGKIAVAKIRCFIETITENTTDLKDGYYNNVFGLQLNNTETAKNLSLEHEAKLKLCEK